MKKDVLFLCQFFYPEHVSSATLPFDTAKAMADFGLSVDAMCGYPKEYIKDLIVPRRETVEGIGIHRLKYLQFKRSGKIGRLINCVSFTASALLRVWKLRNYKSVVVYSNPPILPVVAILGNILFNTKIIFVSYDVYPEIAIVSKVLSKSGVITRVMKTINNSLFNRVYKVVALTDEMKNFLTVNRKGLEPEKVVTIPNWAHEESSKNVCRNRKLPVAGEEITISYLGNMGICQDVETLVETIEMCKADKAYKFIFAGHGSKKESVYGELKNNSQVELYGFLEGQDFQNALDRTTFGVISLTPGLNGMCAPSKYYSYIRSGIPVITVVDENSYLFNEVKENNIGLAVNIGDSKKLFEQLQALIQRNDEILKMSANASKLYLSKYAKKYAMKAYYDILS